MKNEKVRFSVFCLVVALIVCLPVSSPLFKEKVCENMKYYFYAKDVILKSESAEYIKNGNSYIVCCSFDDASKVKKQLDGIMGESVRIINCSKNTKQKILSRYQKYIVDEQCVDEYQTYLCYNPQINDFVIVDGKKVNVQIAIKNYEINLGFPLILNGY